MNWLSKLWSSIKSFLLGPEWFTADEGGYEDPFDHDKRNGPGGSLKSSERGLDHLWAEAEALGIRVDYRWGEKTLRQKIELARMGAGKLEKSVG